MFETLNINKNETCISSSGTFFSMDARFRIFIPFSLTFLLSISAAFDVVDRGLSFKKTFLHLDADSSLLVLFPTGLAGSLLVSPHFLTSRRGAFSSPSTLVTLGVSPSLTASTSSVGETSIHPCLPGVVLVLVLLL